MTRHLPIGLLCAIAFAADAQAVKREAWQESAAEMGFGPCPAKVRREAGIDSTQDWRVYADPGYGFRYCVPAWWTTDRPAPAHPDRIVWMDGEEERRPNRAPSRLSSLVTGRLSVPIKAMYPAEYPEGSRPGIWMGTIGGVKAEMWGDKAYVIALFRSEELMFSAHSQDRATAQMQRTVIKSIRFTATSASGNP